MSKVHTFDTLYDTLGVNPSADKVTCGQAFRTKMLALLEPEFEVRSSMWQSQQLGAMAKLIEAIGTLGHGDRKECYDRQLRKNGILCSLCEGGGRILGRYGMGGIPCAACEGTGKSKNYLAQ
jgi:hypothetical protein